MVRVSDHYYNACSLDIIFRLYECTYWIDFYFFSLNFVNTNTFKIIFMNYFKNNATVNVLSSVKLSLSPEGNFSNQKWKWLSVLFWLIWACSKIIFFSSSSLFNRFILILFFFSESIAFFFGNYINIIPKELFPSFVFYFPKWMKWADDILILFV